MQYPRSFARSLYTAAGQKSVIMRSGSGSADNVGKGRGTAYRRQPLKGPSGHVDIYVDQ
jgi:hypothetical protein